MPLLAHMLEKMAKFTHVFTIYSLFPLDARTLVHFGNATHTVQVEVFPKTVSLSLAVACGQTTRQIHIFSLLDI